MHQTPKKWKPNLIVYLTIFMTRGHINIVISQYQRFTVDVNKLVELD